MKKVISILLLILVITAMISLPSCNETNSTTNNKANNKANNKTTITLTEDNFHDYFDVSIEYYNFAPKELGGVDLGGINTNKSYEATVSQRIKITPKSNVVSCENVKLKFNTRNYYWSYKESTQIWDLELKLSSTKGYDESFTLYYRSSTSPATCPVPSSILHFDSECYVNGTITINK